MKISMFFIRFSIGAMFVVISMAVYGYPIEYSSSYKNNHLAVNLDTIPFLVKGVVTDDQGETLPGVNITIVGDIRGVTTDIEFTDKNGVEIEQYASMEDNTTVLQDSISSLKYRALFLPEPTALDIFATENVEYPILY